MISDNSSSGHPKPAEERPHAGSNSDTAESLRQCSDAGSQTVMAAIEWAAQLTQCLGRQQLVSELLETKVDLLSERLGQLQTPLDGIQSSLRLETSRLLDAIRATAQRQDAIDHNLEQTRRLAENLDRRMERLTDDFIDRHVTEPLFKHFAGLLSSLRSLASAPQPPPQEDINSLADGIERLLDDHGLTITQPAEGDALDPHVHQPVQMRLTDNSALHGRIAGNFQSGLRNAHRIIQPARVAVFTCSKPLTKGKHHE